MKVYISHGTFSEVKPGNVSADQENKSVDIWFHGSPSSFAMGIKEAKALRAELDRLIPEAEALSQELYGQHSTE